MSDAPKPPEPPLKKRPDDAPSWADGAALGIGCLVALIMLAVVIYVGMSRG